MRKLCPLLASLALFGWTGAVNAALMQEILFYFPGDGTTMDRFGSRNPPASLLPSVTVTLPTPSGLCISPCWDIIVRPSAYDPNVHTAAWVPDSLTAGGEWNSPVENGPVEFDPLVITAEILQEGSNDPTPFQAIITTEGELPGEPGTSGEEGGEGPGVFNTVLYCEPESQDQTCSDGIEGSAISRPVPLPSTLLLFGIGLFGLARIRR